MPGRASGGGTLWWDGRTWRPVPVAPNPTEPQPPAACPPPPDSPDTARSTSSRFPDSPDDPRWTTRSADQGPIVALVVLPVLARLERAPPIGVLLVPANSPLETFRERDPRLPTQRREARDVERVAIVRARPVGDELDQASRLAQDVQHALSDTQAIRLDACPDVGHATGGCFMKHPGDCSAVGPHRDGSPPPPNRRVERPAPVLD